jgi:uncharacterized protein (TIGR03435 family)
LLLAAGCVVGQTAGQTPAFEVASVKPSEPLTPAMVASGKLHVGMKIDAKRVDIGNMSLMQLICKAYDVKPFQVSGPSWLQSLGLAGQRFDIVANIPEGATKEQVPQMLQGLLAERFKLAIHRESKEQAVYAMVVGKGELKIKPSAPPPAASDGTAPSGSVTGSNSVSITQGKGGATVSDGTGKSQKMTPSPDGKSMRLEITGATLAELAEGLSPMTDHPVVDMTGLPGKYDMTLDISMQELMNVARAAGAAVPPPPTGDAASDPGNTVAMAVQAIGLKLDPRKVPTAFIVVDHIEKMPTEN